MAEGSSDPFDWSIDEVVQYLCHTSFTDWSISNVPPPRPDPTFLAQKLRENDVTGDVLLAEVTRHALLEDFGIRSLGQRATIVRAIEHLRKSSRKYAESSYQVTSTPSLSVNGENDTPRPIPPLFGTPQNPQGQNSPSQSFRTARDCFVTPSTPAPPPPLPKPDAVRAQSPSARDDAPAELSNTDPSLDLQMASERPRKYEHMVVGKDGKKRRKLDLTTSDRVRPTLSPSQTVRWYMGREKLAAPDVFYKDIDRDSSSDDDDFTFMQKSPVAVGKHLFVKQQMQHYFRQPLREVTKKDGQKSMAIFPYEAPQDLNTPRYFTLFSKDSGSVIATKEDIADWPELDQRPDGFRGLLQKYPPKEDEEDVLPAYGDSGSEGDYDSDTWKEIEEESTAAQGPKILRSVDADGTIEDCITGFVSTWHSKYRPAQERKARNLWVKSRKTRTVHTKIKNATLQIALLDQRLKKLQQAVRENQWSKVEEIKKQCQVMEHTVFDRELQKWKISVLELETRPPKPPPLPLPPRKSKPPKPAFDEESLSSDSPLSSDDDMSDFIVDDSPKKPPVTPAKPATFDPSPVKPSPTVLPEVPPMRLDSDEDDEPVTPYRKRKLFGSARKSLALGGQNTISPASSSRTQWSKTIPPNVDVVDLTALSDNEPLAEAKASENIETKASDGAETEGFEVHTPPLNPVGMVKGSETPHTKASGTSDQLKSPQTFRSNDELPSHTDVKGLLRLDWNILEEKQDRKRLLTKLVASISGEDRAKLRIVFNQLSPKRRRKRIRRGLKALSNSEKTLEPYDEDESNASLRMTSFFISWFVCRHLLAVKGIHKDHLKRADEAGSENIKLFCSELSAVLQLSPDDTSSHKHLETQRVKASDSPNKQHPSQPVLLEGSDYESSSYSQVGPEIRTPRKKRKRAVQQSQEAMDVQRRGQRRVKQEERKRMQLLKRFESSGLGNSDPGRRQAVSFDNPVLYLDPHIGRRVKPHQLDGVQFMWRELIKDEKQQGCLLAHTMGLGKTMQVISLLVTIANAGNSADSRIRNQVPERLRRSRTLVMCPSALIENWHDEFLEWVPGDDKTVGNLGQIRKIETSTTQALSQRLAEIDAWYTRGGILLISYTIFKNTVLNNAGPKRPAPLTPDRHVVVRKQLLEGPNIIVADEAHTMKNPKTKVADATRAFVSKSRIALTGSPLANNLTDYYAMIDWIAPGYLGSFKQFQANYVEPIQEGLYADSTSAERRKSLKKLQVLKEDLDPKINRHDITALKGDLPPKVEFVITIPLTDLQKRAYELYLSTIFGGEDASNARLWDWLAILSLCCAHPSCFMAKLVARNESYKKTRQPKITDSESEAVSPAEDLPSPASDEEPALPIEDVTEDVAPQSVSETVMAELQRLFNAVPDQDCPSLSHRVQILNQIVRRSIKAGDKVLVFSHSLPSLSYIERLLTKQGIKHCRLDGQMRAGLRQNAVKQFNTRDDLDVFLISTRAGGQGLNIYGANRVILFDFQFNPSWEEQAIGRAYRLGQKKDVFVYRFIAGGTFESAVHNRTLYKMQLASRVVDKKNPIRRASRNNTQYLRAPKEVEQIDLSEFKGKDSVLDAILAKGLPIRKIELDETFQREDGDKLTAEELKDVQEELQLEQLKRNNPVEWARQESIREAEKRKMEIEREERYRHWHNTSTQAAPNGVPSQPQPRNPPPPPFSYAPGGPAGQAMRLAFPPQHPPVPPNYFQGHPMSMNPQPPYFANPPPLPPDRRLLADGSAPPPSSAPSSTVFGNNDALFGTQSPAIPASVNQTPATPQAQQQQAPETVSEGHQAKELPETRDVNMGDVEHTLPQTTTAEASSNTEIQSDSAEDKVVEKPTDKQADKPPEGADIEMTGVDGDQPRRNETVHSVVN